MRNRQQKEVNALPMRFAFSQEQFHEVMKEWGLDPKKDLDKIARIPFGGFIQKKDAPLMHESFARHHRELQAAIDAAMTAWQAAQTYQTLEDVPEWGRPAVEKLVAAGVLLGDETGLNLSRDMVRMLVILDRLQSN